MSAIYLKDSNAQLMQEMQSAGFNVVTCGNCGSIRFHRTNHEGDLDCENCGFISDQCDFPDFVVVEAK